MPQNAINSHQNTGFSWDYENEDHIRENNQRISSNQLDTVTIDPHQSSIHYGEEAVTRGEHLSRIQNYIESIPDKGAGSECSTVCYSNGENNRETVRYKNRENNIGNSNGDIVANNQARTGRQRKPMARKLVENKKKRKRIIPKYLTVACLAITAIIIICSALLHYYIKYYPIKLTLNQGDVRLIEYSTRFCSGVELKEGPIQRQLTVLSQAKKSTLRSIYSREETLRINADDVWKREFYLRPNSEIVIDISSNDLYEVYTFSNSKDFDIWKERRTSPTYTLKDKCCKNRAGGKATYRFQTDDKEETYVFALHHHNIQAIGATINLKAHFNRSLLDYTLTEDVCKAQVNKECQVGLHFASNDIVAIEIPLDPNVYYIPYEHTVTIQCKGRASFFLLVYLFAYIGIAIIILLIYSCVIGMTFFELRKTFGCLTAAEREKVLAMAYDSNLDVNVRYSTATAVSEMYNDSYRWGEDEFTIDTKNRQGSSRSVGNTTTKSGQFDDEASSWSSSGKSGHHLTVSDAMSRPTVVKRQEDGLLQSQPNTLAQDYETDKPSPENEDTLSEKEDSGMSSNSSNEVSPGKESRQQELDQQQQQHLLLADYQLNNLQTNSKLLPSSHMYPSSPAEERFIKHAEQSLAEAAYAIQAPQDEDLEDSPVHKLTEL